MNLTQAQNLLKIVYAEPLINQIIRHTDCLDMFQQKSKVKHNRQGKYIEVSNLYTDPEGVGARAEQDYLPQAVDPQAVNQQIYLKYQYMTVQLTKQVMVDMQRGPAAFINWARLHLRNVTMAMKNDMDRQIIGTGAGVIARVNQSTPAAAMVVDSAYGVSDYNTEVSGFFRKGARYVFSGNVKNASDRRTGTNRYAVCKSFDVDTNTVNFDTAGSNNIPTDVADNDYIFRGDGASHNAPGAANARNKECTGLLAHIDDGDIVSSYFNLTRSDEYDFLKSHVMDGTANSNAGNLTEKLMLKLKDRIEQYGMGMPDTLVGSRGVWRNYFGQLVDDRSFNDRRSYEGGAKDLSIMLGDRNMMLKVGNRIPPGTLFMIDTSTLEKGQTNKLEFGSETGSIWKQVVDGTGYKDEYIAHGRWFIEFFCNSPQKSGRIDKLTDG